MSYNSNQNQNDQTDMSGTTNALPASESTTSPHEQTAPQATCTFLELFRNLRDERVRLNRVIAPIELYIEGKPNEKSEARTHAAEIIINVALGLDIASQRTDQQRELAKTTKPHEGHAEDAMLLVKHEIKVIEGGLRLLKVLDQVGWPLPIRWSNMPASILARKISEEARQIRIAQVEQG